MDEVPGKIATIENCCARDVGRNISPLYGKARGGLIAAGRSIADHRHPHVAIITGFFIPHGQPPAPETDGPIGAAHLAKALLAADIPVRLATDSLCLDAVKAAVAASYLDSPVYYDEILVPKHLYQASIFAVLEKWRGLTPPISHVIAIERAGPAKDGIHRNMAGHCIDPWDGATASPLSEHCRPDYHRYWRRRQ
jgi:hypothetical protein